MRIVKLFEEFTAGERLNNILDKISELGIESLSNAERAFLDAHSTGAQKDVHNKMLDKPDNSKMIIDPYIFCIGSGYGDEDGYEFAYIQSKKYWDEEKCLYDGHSNLEIDNMEEIAESTYEFKLDVKVIIKNLIDKGYSFCAEFQDFIDSDYMIGNESIIDYMSRVYPNEMV